MIEKLFDTMVVASSDKSGYNDPSNISAGNCFEPP